MWSLCSKLRRLLFASAQMNYPARRRRTFGKRTNSRGRWIVKKGRACICKKMCETIEGQFNTDGLELCWLAWENLARPKKQGRIRFLNFSMFPPLEFFFSLNANPTPLDYVIGVYSVKIILLLLGKDRPLVPIGWPNLQILRWHIWSLSNVVFSTRNF